MNIPTAFDYFCYTLSTILFIAFVLWVVYEVWFQKTFREGVIKTLQDENFKLKEDIQHKEEHNYDMYKYIRLLQQEIETLKEKENKDV